MTRRLVTAALLAAAVTAAAAPAAHASEIVTRDAKKVRLFVNRGGKALVSWRADGERRRALVWGAVNAIRPKKGRKQVDFRWDRGVSRGDVRRFRDACRRYRGPKIPLAVRTCTARDGSHWALQAWRRLNRNGGWKPFAHKELHISHWKGELPQLWLKWDWAYNGANNAFAPFDHLYGRFTYRGHGIHGFKVSRFGNPLDSFGRNVYVDGHGTPWGRGWRRINGFLSHKPLGNFCDGVYPNRFGRRDSPGRGARYRATAMGPGVTPIVRWGGPPPGPYRPGTPGHPLDFVLAGDTRSPFDAGLDARLDAEQEALAPADDRCHRTR